ncbi:hypothetical protein Lal_00028064 [Lupinus albus]|nr:hypothetical protein Lal_00028064 [Lupinus albus]
MSSWNSIPLHISYEVVGWFAFLCWSISFYPQLILNFRRKSVVGLNFDFAVINLIKQSSYLIYNASLYFSSVVQKQYEDKYGQKEMIPVAANDVAFSIHAVLLTTITLFQITIYERGSQRVSKTASGIIVVVLLTVTTCFFIALPKHHWLWLLFVFKRKSTEGWSIGFSLLDFSGGIANYAQMSIQSIDQGSWKNLYGNVGKVLISLVSVLFDIIFMCQHYLLYPSNNTTSETTEHNNFKSLDQPLAQNV